MAVNNTDYCGQVLVKRVQIRLQQVVKACLRKFRININSGYRVSHLAIFKIQAKLTEQYIVIEKGRVLTKDDRALIVSPAHDKPGRSASLLWDSLFELDNTFIPKAVDNFFTQEKMFNGINFLESIPEHHTAFDNLGKGRMHDLVIEAECADERIIIAVEAKVDEPFDHKTIVEYRDQGLAIQAKGKNSNKPARIEKLLNAMFNQSQHLVVENLKYQLLQATAGTLAEAKKRNASKAIFCVLNFRPETPSERYVFKNKHNSIHLSDFVKSFPETVTGKIETNQLYGPITVPGDAEIPNDVPLYFLKLEQVFHLQKSEA